MNRNEIIGTFILKALGYAVQGFIISEVASLRSFALIKAGTKYTVKLINLTSKNYVRTDFKSEKIFSDTIDASFFAD